MTDAKFKWEYSFDIFHVRFQYLMRGRKVPKDWQSLLNSFIREKLNRNVSLLGKVYARINFERVTQDRKEEQRFSKGRGCVDHLFTLKHIS